MNRAMGGKAVEKQSRLRITFPFFLWAFFAGCHRDNVGLFGLKLLKFNSHHINVLSNA
jgi:hypothetical protein